MAEPPTRIACLPLRIARGSVSQPRRPIDIAGRRVASVGLVGPSASLADPVIRFVGPSALLVDALGSLVGPSTSITYASVSLVGPSTLLVDALVTLVGPSASLADPVIRLVGPSALLSGGALGFGAPSVSAIDEPRAPAAASQTHKREKPQRECAGAILTNRYALGSVLRRTLS
jgi:hypothetical protein